MKLIINLVFVMECFFSVVLRGRLCGYIWTLLILYVTTRRSCSVWGGGDGREMRVHQTTRTSWCRQLNWWLIAYYSEGKPHLIISITHI